MNVRRPECDEQPLRPMLRNARRHGAAALGSDDRSAAGRETAIGGEGLPKIGVHGDQSAAAVLGCDVPELDHGSDVAGWIEHHVPGQVGDFTGAQTSLGGQQDDHTVTKGMPGAVGKDQEVVDVAKREYFCLLAWHIGLKVASFSINKIASNDQRLNIQHQY
jgi:hypothetical protein